MPFHLKHIDDLAVEMGSKDKARRALDASGVVVINGFYDHGALEAMFAEPKASNIEKREKDLWTIAHTDGVGAIKHCLDKVGLDITRHLYHGTNYITVRNARNKRRSVKVYSTARTMTQHQIAYFNVIGFLDAEKAPSHYMFICYEGPIAWLLSREELVEHHTKLIESRGWRPDTPGFSIPPSQINHKRGMLRLALGADDESYLLSSARQLGL